MDKKSVKPKFIRREDVQREGGGGDATGCVVEQPIRMCYVLYLMVSIYMVCSAIIVVLK